MMLFEFAFPDVGEGVHEGKVLQLKCKPGETVSAGDILAVIETDKVVAEIPSPKSGILKKYGAEEGQIIHVGDILAYIEIEGDGVQADTSEEEDNAGVGGELELARGGAVLPASGEGMMDGAAEDHTLDNRHVRVLATPVARKMASNLNVDLTKIDGTGPGGRIMKSDIQKATHRSEMMKSVVPAEDVSEPTDIISKPEPQNKLSEAALFAQPVGVGQVQSLSTMRRTIARNMEESNQIPAAVIQDFTDIDALLVLRDKLNEGREGTDRLSFQPFFIKALAAAIKKYPGLNSTYNPSKMEITRSEVINIGLAVDTEAGLMVPVVKHAESKSIETINAEMRKLAEMAQKRTIALDDLRGGTISLTNYGAFGGVYGVPMINPPQVAIMGIGRMHKAPIVKDDAVIPAMVLPVSLPFDHRVVDGALASKFVSYYLSLLQNPDKLLVSI